MKKLLLSLLIVAGLCLHGQAQGIKAGLKAGLNFSTLKFDEEILDTENSLGYQAGGWVRLGAGKIHLQPEVYFTGKNATVSYTPSETAQAAVKGDVKFSNIDVPILLGTRFPIGPLSGRLQAGPLFSFVVNQSDNFGDNLDAAYRDAITNYKDRSAAIVGGLGFDLSNIAVDVRYEHGLGNITKDQGNKQTLNLWTISVGYSFF